MPQALLFGAIVGGLSYATLGATLLGAVLVGASVAYQVVKQQRLQRNLARAQTSAIGNRSLLPVRPRGQIRAAITAAKWRFGITRCSGVLSQVAWAGLRCQFTVVIGEAPISGVTRVWVNGRGIDVVVSAEGVADLTVDQVTTETSAARAMRLRFFLSGDPLTVGGPGPLTLFDPPDQSFVLGTAVDWLLPAATGGTGNYTYSVTGLFSHGVSFSPLTRRITGLLGGTPGPDGFDYIVDDGVTEVTVSIRLTRLADTTPLTLTAFEDRTFVIGAEVDWLLPAATGGTGVYFYSVAGLLSHGVMFDIATRSIVGLLGGTPGDDNFTYTVDDGDNTVVVSGRLIRTDVTTLLVLPDPPDMTFLIGAELDWLLPEATGGTGTYTYSVMDLVSSGVSFHPLTRRITGLLGGTPGSDSFEYTVNDGVTTVSVVIVLIRTAVITALILPDPPDRTFEIGSGVNWLLPAATGGTGTYTYSVSGLASNGVSFSPITRRITGTLGGTAGTDGFTYRVEDGNTMASVSIVLTRINVPLALPDPPNRSFGIGTSVNWLLPAATGGTGNYTYSVTGLASHGLSFSPSTRRITGLLGGTPGSDGFNYIVDDGDNTLTWQVVLTRTYVTLVLSDPSDQSFVIGTSVNWLLPAATGGTGNYTYSVAGLASHGVSFSSSTRRITGLLGGTAGTDNFTYTVDDNVTTVTVSIRLIRTNVPLVLSDPPDRTFELGSVVNWLLPAATGGTGNYTYSVAGLASNGVSFSPSTRRITGTLAGTPGDDNFVYTVDDGDNSTSVSILLTRVSSGSRFIRSRIQPRQAVSGTLDPLIAAPWDTAEGLRWQPDMVMTGLAFCVVELYNNEDRTWWRGIPQIEFLTQGYIWRAAGGPLAVITNAAVVRRWWERIREGEPVERIDDSHYTAAVTICDTMDYQVNGTIEATDNHEAVRAVLDTVWDGTVVDWGGTLRFLPGAVRPVTLTIPADDILVLPEVRPSPELAARVNQVAASLDQAAIADWEPQTLPEVVSLEAQARDGGVLRHDIGVLDLVTDGTIGLRMARRIMLEGDGLDVQLTVPFGTEAEPFRYIAIAPGTLVTVTGIDGLDGKRFRVEGTHPGGEDTLVLDLSEEVADRYTADGGTLTAPGNVVYSEPTAEMLAALTELTMEFVFHYQGPTAIEYRLEVQWEEYSVLDAAIGTRVELYRESDLIVSTALPRQESRFNSGFTPDLEYRVRVARLLTGGRLGAWAEITAEASQPEAASGDTPIPVTEEPGTQGQ